MKEETSTIVLAQTIMDCQTLHFVDMSENYFVPWNLPAILHSSKFAMAGAQYLQIRERTALDSF